MNYVFFVSRDRRKGAKNTFIVVSTAENSCKLEIAAPARVFLMKSLQEYTVVIRSDDNGTFVAYVPAIPSCHAWGQTLDEARAELVCVFEMIQEEFNQPRLSKDFD